MRTKRAQVSMVAAAVAAMLPLAGCGSSQPAAKLSPTTPAGTPATSSTSASPTSATSSSSSSAPSGSASTDANGLPDLTLNPDVTLQFNLPTITDPVENAALQGLTQVEKAKYKATELRVTSGPIVDDFSVKDGNKGVWEYATREEQAGVTPTGTLFYYDWQFTGASADHTVYQFKFCEDQKNFFDKNVTTGQTSPPDPRPKQIIGFRVNMLKDADGRWKAATYGWTTGDVTCQKAEGH